MLISNRALFWVLLFSVLSVWSHWNLFTTGVYALGVNATLFWMGIAVCLYLTDSSYRIKHDWPWLIPLILIGVSFSLYENPWMKLISLLLLPIAVGIFVSYSQMQNRKQILWNAQMVLLLWQRLFKPIISFGEVAMSLFHRTISKDEGVQKGFAKRVTQGVLLLIPLGAGVILLLSSADDAFSQAVSQVLDNLFRVVNWTTLSKLCLSFFLSVLLLAMRLRWSEMTKPRQLMGPPAPVDGVIAGIVLSGLLSIYVVFLYLQLDHLVIGTLPELYWEAERMVKSGFWQLFVLAILNTALFFIVYKKTGQTAQVVLKIFIIASSLLMVSAAWKVWLYSYTFGFSYEKYFALYTALFGLGVLMYLIVASFARARQNVVRVIVFAALWGYGVATVTPIEKIIFHANVYLAKQDNTRITLNQLTQLSMDILPDVNAIGVENLSVNPSDVHLWGMWRWGLLEQRCTRPWYERNLATINSCVKKK